MNNTNQQSRHLQIISAIFAKDMADAIKNRTFISLTVGLLVMMLSAQALPLALSLRGDRNVAILNPSEGLLSGLEAAGYRVRPAETAEELELIVVSTPVQQLGLSMPSTMDESSPVDHPLVLQAFSAWQYRSSAQANAQALEGALTAILGRPVTIEVGQRYVYPSPDEPGSHGMVAVVWSIILLSVGAFVVPHVFFEEKQAHTLDAILSSPASPVHILAGKALVGLAYCIAFVAVAVVLNWALIVQWGLVIVAMLCGSILCIAIGLLLGNVFESSQQMGLWVGVPMIALWIPASLSGLGTDIPSWLERVMPALPTVAMTKLFLLSFAQPANTGTIFCQLAIVLLWSIPFFGAVLWLLRRADR